MWITILWKILKEMGIPDHLFCLLRNLYAGKEATVRTGNLDGVLKSKDITLPTKVHIVKAMVFPVVRCTDVRVGS